MKVSTLLLFAGWTLVIVLLCGHTVFEEYEAADSFALSEAKADMTKDIAFRSWAASHGGVYVFTDKDTPPNPYLDVPMREIEVAPGKILTLMNPAYMTRQFSDQFWKKYGRKTHLTSLKPINPGNAPDPWEEKVLTGFETDSRMFHERTFIDNKPFMRAMLPLFVEEGCLNCHRKQGYKLGDIRGGISVAIPLDAYIAHAADHSMKYILIYLFLWVLGSLALLNTWRRGVLLIDERIKREAERTERKKQEELLVYQSRKALMGEMIGNIAHQWKQPLNICSIQMQEMKLALDDGNFTKEGFDDTYKTVTQQIKHMAKTIDIFRNFFKPTERQESFDLYLKTKEVLELIGKIYVKSGVTIQLEGEEGCTAWGYPADFNQVVINLLNNARDAIVDNDCDEKTIWVKARKGERYSSLTVCDKAGGIHPKLIGVLFEPYFTTKEKGTGIGLTMSKMIIEEKMEGKLTVENREGGACFTISVPASPPDEWKERHSEEG